MMGTDPNQSSTPPASPTGGAGRVPGGEAGGVGGAGASGDPAADITEDSVRLALRKVKDPELNLNIVDLGLVYGVTVDDGNKVIVDMSLTSHGCPAGPQIIHDVERTVQAMPGVGKVVVNLVWEPFWTPERIEPRVRAYMGL